MKLTKEFTNLEKSAVKLTVTIAKKDVEESYNSTVAKYVKSAQIPGFRKGHVPAAVLERKFMESKSSLVRAGPEERPIFSQTVWATRALSPVAIFTSIPSALRLFMDWETSGLGWSRKVR